MIDSVRNGEGLPGDRARGDLRLGPDRVSLLEDRLVIHSPVDMEYWEVLRYRKPLIHFQGRSWSLVDKNNEGADRFRYELVPWSPGVAEFPAHEIHYDAGFVERRDLDLASSRRLELAYPLFLLVSPLIGLLWSKTKQRLEGRFGIAALTATRRSIVLEYIIGFICLGYLAIGSMVTALGYPAPMPLQPFVVAILILAPDAIMRYDHLLREVEFPPGFYQWVVNRR